MRIVLPGTLPDPREARELTVHLQKTAPTLLAWLQRAHARTISADPTEAGCTPYEKWQLLAHGFEPGAGQNFATGLGPLLAPGSAQSDQAIWLTELVHVSPSRDGAALLPARELAITPEQSVALFESVDALFADVGFKLYPVDVNHWRIELPQGYSPASASPSLVSITSVNDWWPQDVSGRPWRRLVNEVQMLWFDHPINQARYEQGLAPINSLWLFGGARAGQIRQPAQANAHSVYSDLLDYAVKHDWGGWIFALGELEERVFRPLGVDAQPELVLTGSDRIVELKPQALGRLRQWLPGSREAWRKWWSPLN